MQEPIYQSRTNARLYDIIGALFVAFLVLSNIAATKLIAIGSPAFHLVFDGGAILFPLTYILADVLSEIYGWKGARRIILLGFAVSILASLIFFLVQIAPPAPDYHNQAAFEAVLGFVPRIVAASISGYLVGQLLNAFVLVKIKNRFGENNLWVRLIGSTLVGEAADTVIFCTIAFYGVITGAEFVNYVLTGYFYKCLLEVVLLPLTYPIIRFIKHQESAFQEIS
ncbi:MAG: queuosine precursor transporter [Actinomycetaceae bacterium]|nr:queuosine precursor transporter [Actinomycetaceae bacterium]